MTQPLQPMRKQSLSEGIFEQLRDQILNGKLPPGSRLTPEAALAEAAGVSRLTVREAIRRLEQAGLIGVSQGTAPKILDFRENSGPEVLPHLLFASDGGVDTAVARSILEMRDLMAPEIARLAALRAGPATAQPLENALERLRAVTGEPAEFLLRTLEFDLVLVDACDSIAYRLVSNPLRRVLEAVAGFLGPVLPDASEELRHREELARAVVASDSERAERIFRAILESGTARIHAALDALDRAAAGSSDSSPDASSSPQNKTA